MNKTHKYILFGLCILLIFQHVIPGLNQVDIFDGRISFRQNVFIGGVILLFLEFFESEMEKLKNMSYKILADNLGSSITGSRVDTESVGPWISYRLGGLLVPIFGIVMAGREGTLITHHLSAREKEGGVNIQGKAEEVEKDELPPDVKELVEREELPEPIYLVTAPSEVKKQNQTYIKREDIWKDIQQLENEREMMEKQRMKDTERIVKFRDNINQSKTEGELQRMKEKMGFEE